MTASNVGSASIPAHEHYGETCSADSSHAVKRKAKQIEGLTTIARLTNILLKLDRLVYEQLLVDGSQNSELNAEMRSPWSFRREANAVDITRRSRMLRSMIDLINSVSSQTVVDHAYLTAWAQKLKSGQVDGSQNSGEIIRNIKQQIDALIVGLREIRNM
ncbi:hypothetical protein IAT40_003814 [Kwoniella sp. CBS 6097]